MKNICGRKFFVVYSSQCQIVAENNLTIVSFDKLLLPNRLAMISGSQEKETKACNNICGSAVMSDHLIVTIIGLPAY